MKKIIVSILLLTLLIIPVSADQPSDWASDVIDQIFEQKLLDARMQSAYQSDISRADFAYLGVRLYENITGRAAVAGDASFPDSDDPFVLKAKALGVVDGYEDGSYRPAKAISRQELAVLFINALRAAEQPLEIEEREIFDDDQSVAGWAKKSVYTARALGVVEGVGKNVFNPTGTATREQAMIMFKRVNDRYAKVEDNAANKDNSTAPLQPPTSQAQKPPTAETINVSDFTVDDLNLSDYADKPIVLIFFDAQCAPCLEQFATVQQVYQDYRKTHHFIAVDCTVKGAKGDLKHLRARYDIKYPIADDDGSIARDYAVQALPTTLLIDGEKVVGRYIGALSEDALRTLIER